MKRGIIYLLLVTLIIPTILCACDSKTELDEIESYYTSYLEAFSNDPENAIKQYMYFDDPIYKRIALENTNDRFLSYKIDYIEKLSDNLWVVHVWLSSVYIPNEAKYHHFVGIIDGKYKVMNNVVHIPSDLVGSLDLEKYKNSVVSPDEIYPLISEDET